MMLGGSIMRVQAAKLARRHGREVGEPHLRHGTWQFFK